MSAVTLATIEKLLNGITGNDEAGDDHGEHTTSLLQDERILTALVLYTRLDSPATPDDDIDNFWRSHAAVLVPWMQNLIQPSLPTDDDDGDDDDDNVDHQHHYHYHDTAGPTTTSSNSNRPHLHRLFVRLVAQLLISVTSTNKSMSDHIVRTVIEPLGTTLMKVWNAFENVDDHDESSSIRMVTDDPDLLAGIHAWLAIRVEDKEKWAQNDVIFRQIVERLVIDSKGDPKDRNEPVKHSTEEARHRATVEQATSPETLMIQTLSTILNQNGPFHQSEEPPSLTDCVEQSGLSLLFCQHCRYATESSMPSFFRPLLDWWVVHQSCNSRCSNNVARDRGVWAQVLLLSTLELSKKNHRQKLLLQQSDLSSLTKVLLASVISISPATTRTNRSTSTSATNEELRTLAWTTGASLGELYGWNVWLVRSSGSSSSNHNNTPPLGHASQLCAWLRLAAGEWKIQLGWFLTGSKNDVSEGNNNNADYSSLIRGRIRIVQACAHILVQGLQYMTQMADRMDDDDDKKLTALSADAILHIQKSLQETLHSTVQYLEEPRFTLQESPDFSAVTDSVIFVLGNLLSEMDAFASIPSSKDALDENEILKALVSALKYDSSGTAQEYLLPGLATVFASSEGDATRIQLLKKYGLTGTALEEYFVTYFRRTNTLESLSWACQLVDLWTDMVPVDANGALLDSVLICLQRLLSMNGRAKELGEALSSTVACYVTLRGNEPPNERDTQIIQHAMEMSSSMLMD